MERSIATYIDHTLLKQDATKEEIKKLCDEAKKYGFASVCVNPYWVKYAKEQLTNSNVDVCTVIGFPLGATTTNVKKYEAIDAIENGATELDVVINISALKDRDDDTVLNDIKAIVDVAKEKAIVKVIIETSLLTDEEKVRACELAVKAGAHYVKTSTGFSSHGATVSDVALMRKTVGEHVGVKASGGIRTYQDARSMIEAGATRIGASRGVEIVQQTIS